eukprot:scaffold1640_cov101-Cylindrotheca_fusiformis.AAC.2
MALFDLYHDKYDYSSADIRTICAPNHLLAIVKCDERGWLFLNWKGSSEPFRYPRFGHRFL